MGTSQADIDNTFSDQATQLRTVAKQEADNWTGAKAVDYYLPKLGDWDGDLSNVDGISKAFKRDDINQAYSKLADKAEGVLGDGVVLATQADWLALLERAYRARNLMTPIRALAHATARRKGHGQQTGLFGQGVLEYLRGVLKQSKGNS